MEAYRNNMNNYRFARLPGTKFQEKIKSDPDVIQELADILNLYTEIETCPKHLPQMLEVRFDVKWIYKGFACVGFLTLLLSLFFPTHTVFISGASIACIAVAAALLTLYYQKACHYKLLNLTVSHLPVTELIRHAILLNRALKEEADSNPHKPQ